MKLVFIDTETTGLDYDRHGIIELAWAHEDGPIHSFVLPHEHLMYNADPRALEINQYHERDLANARKATTHELNAFVHAVTGNQILGANVRFDARMIENFFKFEREPWHYRLFDFSAWAAGRLGWDTVKGMSEIWAALKQLEYFIPEPDHTAAGDVETMRRAYKLMKDPRFTGTLE